jgi:hypothetical protein
MWDPLGLVCREPNPELDLPSENQNSSTLIFTMITQRRCWFAQESPDSSFPYLMWPAWLVEYIQMITFTSEKIIPKMSEC